jgi:hypothetical protein
VTTTTAVASVNTTTTVAAANTTTTEAPILLQDGICYCLGATGAENIATRPAAERAKIIQKISELRRQHNQNFTVSAPFTS